MKLKPDCIRDVLLYLEEHLDYENDEFASTRVNEISWNMLFESEELLSMHTVSEIKYSLQKLHEIQFIEAKITTTGKKGWVACDIVNITWNGHEFLDTIRGKTIWDATKKQAKKLGGVSIRMLGNVATSITQAVVTNPNFIQNIVNTIK